MRWCCVLMAITNLGALLFTTPWAVKCHRIEKGQAQITLIAALPGIYFIDVEGATNQIKWVVE